VDATALTAAFSQQAGTLFGLYDIFVGGAFSRATIFALGIMPYISASIVLQVLGAVVPYLEKLRKEGEEGQKKINQLTRYGTVSSRSSSPTPTASSCRATRAAWRWCRIRAWAS